MLAAVTFDPVAHRYTLDGRPVPGVTRALQVITADAYAGADPAALAAKAEFGQHVHAVIELDCAGELDVPALDPLLVPWYGAWRAFLALSGFRPRLSEGLVASRRYGYCGKLDLFGDLPGDGIRTPSHLAVIDAKCVTTVMPSTGPQTAAYEAALRECRPDLLPAGTPCKRYALQLHPGRSRPFTLHPFADPADLRLFLACLTVTHHKDRR